MEQKDPHRAQRAILAWNDHHRFWGTPVIYESIKGDSSTRRQTKATSAAFVADSGIAVIFVEGVSGYVALDHITEARGT